ncbi:signal peptidase II [Planctomycetales bacterium ZRK34]|nr:signal peptidase II [Planctomycetales bacterium ZRK34]
MNTPSQPSPPPVDPAATRHALRSVRAIATFLIIFTVCLVADLAIKHWAFNNFTPEPIDIHAVVAGEAGIPHDSMTIVPKVLAIKLTLNQGAVFGMFQGQRWFFMLATIVAIGVVGIFFAGTTPQQWPLHAALALVLSGAMGNLYDRVFYAAVRDMFWLFPNVMLPFGWRWPNSPTGDVYPWLFNAADAFLLIGIGLILIYSLLGKSPAAKPNAS